jgi:response regulator RpfG family c-di-GMP phosphodiesterase
MDKKFTKEHPVQVLSIGTKILLKDVMDQYLRSLGEVKTYYASKLSSAMQSYHEKRPEVIFCEQSFPEGSAQEFIEAIGGLDSSGDRYFVLAAESASDTLVALAMENGVDEILVKPFAIGNILQIMERFTEKRALLKHEWVKELRAAKKSLLEKRFQEAEELFAAVAKKHPRNCPAMLDCADFFLRRGQPAKALQLLDLVLAEVPQHAKALHLCGCALRKLGRLQEAAAKLTQANAISPANPLRNIELAETYVAMAEEQVVAALKTESESSALILRRAQFQLLRKDYASLVTYLDSKRAYLSEAGRKEAESLVGIAKKIAGLR